VHACVCIDANQGVHACMRAVFVQLILVCQPHCTSHPQHRATDRVECNWPPDIRRFGGTIAQGEHRQIDGICAALQHINAAYSTHKKPHADINPLIEQTFMTYDAIFMLEKPIPLSFFPRLFRTCASQWERPKLITSTVPCRVSTVPTEFINDILPDFFIRQKHIKLI